MREIKFRAWHKTQNKMRAVWLNKFIDRFGILGPEVFDNDDYSVMQYAGLKDKNGKEIYEGDIISFTHRTMGHEIRAVVEFNYGCFVRNPDWITSPLKSFLDWDIEYTIIGNIHETPELFKLFKLELNG